MDLDTAQLNFHHLRYFWMVATEGNLTRTARRLRVSQSAVSSQIRQLEEHLGEPLFERDGRQLVLTEAGRLTLSYASEIFDAGGRLLATLRTGRSPGDLLRIGSVATLSRNFQESFLEPLFSHAQARLRLVSGGLEHLLDRLHGHDLDLVLSNRPSPGEQGEAFRCQLLAQQAVSLIGHPSARPLRFPDALADVPLLLPTPDSAIRTSFDALCDQLGLTVRVLAEVDDMALLRLLARDTQALALLPSVVVRDELESGALREHWVVPDVEERFYGITARRRFQHPLLGPLLARGEREILAMRGGRPAG